MSRLRRPFLYERYIFVSVRLLPSRGKLEEGDYSRLAVALARMRQKKGFALTAWVFLPDHWHAVIYPPYPLSIAQAMSAIKVSSMVAINHSRNEKGELWQERFFDRAQRTVKEHAETVEYIHLNPVKRGLVNAARTVEVVQLSRVRRRGRRRTAVSLRLDHRPRAFAHQPEREDLTLYCRPVPTK